MSQQSLTDAAALRPIIAGERILALDVVRGFALIGIFLMNIVFFNRPISASLLALTGAILLWAIWSGVRKSRKEARAFAQAQDSAVPAAAAS